MDLLRVWLIRLAVTLDRLSGETEGGKPTHQKQGYSGAQDEAGNHVGAVVPVLGDPIEARQEGWAEGPQAQHGFGQTTALCLDCACDVHLEQDGDLWVRGSLCGAQTHTRVHTHANGGEQGRAKAGVLTAWTSHQVT